MPASSTAISSPCTGRADARSGQIVVARLAGRGGDEVTVKRLKRRGGQLLLVAENPDFAPIVVDPKKAPLTIEGVAVGLVRGGKAAMGSPVRSLPHSVPTGDPMYTLYGKKGSGSASTQAALEIIGAPYRVVETASWATNAAFDELLKLNPLGQIPTLVLPDGSALSESAAILLHLGDAHPESGLLPRDASARAQAIRGLVFIAANCYAAISVIDFPERWCKDADEATQERIRAGTRARLHQYWEMFADLFPARPYLGGEAIGALDLLAAVVSKWSGSRPHLQKARPAFHETLLRIEAQPKVAPVFAQHWPPG